MGIKVALIPPLGWEQYLGYSAGIQMSLAVDSCMAYGPYVSEMRHAASMGNYVIVDNGEAEGQRSQNRHVTGFAASIKASEQVLPDVMGDRHATILRVTEFFSRASNVLPDMKYMAVAQGDERDVRVIVHYFAEFKYRSGPNGVETYPVTTIGIPRNLCTIAGNPAARIDLANWIRKEYGDRFEVHLLGANAAWPQEVQAAARYAEGSIRSIDTSLPFNFALAGKLLEQDVPEAVTRDRLYLTGRLPRVNIRHVARNIDIYKTWARGA